MYITFVSILFICYIHCVLACSDSFPNLCASNQLKVGPYERFGPCNDGSGRDIPKDAAKNQPSIKFSSAQKDKKYMMLMRDPDAGDASDVLHWLLTDISGEDLQAGVIDKNINECYWGPNPPNGQHHRYQFMLFEQKVSPVNESKKKRIGFNTLAFLKDNQLCPSDAVASFQFKSY